MNIVDVVIILLLGLSFVSGYIRGILKEAVMLFGTIIIYIISFNLKDGLGLILCKILPFFKLDGLVSLNIFLYQLIAFVIIAGFLFGIYGIVLKLTGILQKIVDLSIILKFPSKILGGVAGLFEGYIIIFILLIILSIPFSNNELFNSSLLNKKVVTSSLFLSNSLGKIDNVIVDTYDITDKINNKNINTNTSLINLEIVKLYLDYNVVSYDDMKDIIDTGKLDEISSIDNFMRQYKKD